MTRRVFPDDRLVFGPSVNGASLRSRAGTTVTIYTDSAGTTLADLLTYPGGAAVTGSVLTVSSDSLLPLFQGPNDSTDTLYAKPAGSTTLSAIYARVDDRLDAVVASVTAEAAARDAAIAAQALADSGTYGQRGTAFAHLKRTLDEASMSCGITVFGDSTGNETSEWVYLLGQYLATTYPAWGVRYQLWDDTNSRYGAPTEIQAPPTDERHVTLNGGAGSFLYAADAAGNRITGDLDVSVKAALTDWTPAADMCLTAKFGGSGVRSWRFYVQATTGKLVLQWSPDGAASLPTATSTVAPTVADGATLWVRATLDVDNGASGYTATFYTSTDGFTWTTLGSAVTAAGVTSIFAGTNQLELGTRASGSDLLVGNIYQVRIKSGIDGPSVAPELPEGWRTSSATTTSFSGSPVLHITNASVGGQGLSYFVDATRHPKMTPDQNTLVTFASISHNDGTWLGPSYLATWDTLKSLTVARQSMSTVAAIAQNPRVSPATTIEQHASRAAQIMGWARRNSLGFVDVYKAFQDDGRAISGTLVSASDGIHPTAAGEAVWRDAVIAEARL